MITTYTCSSLIALGTVHSSDVGGLCRVGVPDFSALSDPDVILEALHQREPGRIERLAALAPGENARCRRLSGRPHRYRATR